MKVRDRLVGKMRDRTRVGLPGEIIEGEGRRIESTEQVSDKTKSRIYSGPEGFIKPSAWTRDTKQLISHLDRLLAIPEATSSPSGNQLGFSIPSYKRFPFFVSITLLFYFILP